MLLSLLLFAAQAGSTSLVPDPPEIVVTAKRTVCSASLAERVLSSREFKRRAREWARGIPVRVYAPKRSDYRCLAEIAFRLGREGVRNIESVDRPRNALVD